MKITIEKVEPRHEIELKNALIKKGKLYIDKDKEVEWTEFISSPKLRGLDLLSAELALKVIKLLESGESPEEADKVLEEEDTTGAFNYIVAQIVIKYSSRGEEFKIFQKQKGYL
ncbi:MAG: hypothetical protein KAQ64_00205 [Candidatus Pacebacteria bacterium]|nr:hypothetical protein [Candidatus Paceibacterota bacterium]